MGATSHLSIFRSGFLSYLGNGRYLMLDPVRSTVGAGPIAFRRFFLYAETGIFDESAGSLSASFTNSLTVAFPHPGGRFIMAAAALRPLDLSLPSRHEKTGRALRMGAGRVETYNDWF